MVSRVTYRSGWVGQPLALRGASKFKIVAGLLKAFGSAVSIL